MSTLRSHGGRLFFSAYDSAAGNRLWQTDGTAVGTTSVKDGAPGSGVSYPWNLVAANGTLFFSAIDGAAGRELWKSDGTEAGTVRVKDVAAGAASSGPTDLIPVARGPGAQHLVNGAPGVLAQAQSATHLIFAADDGITGRELWQSDGTEPGTQLLQDIAPSPQSSNPADLHVVNSTLVFAANDGQNGLELWAAPIAQMNYAPIAANASLSTPANTPLLGALGASDSDAQPLSFTLVSQGHLGVVTITNTMTGAFRYVPNAGSTGDDSFSFKVNDGIADSNIATVSIAIVPAGTEHQSVYLPFVLRSK